MNTDQIKGQAKQLSGKLKETWGKLTDDDLALYEGQRDQFLGRVQQQYGIAKEDAEKKLRMIEESYKTGSSGSSRHAA
ncbi:MAG: CsbD family protein [Alphaproteobacteria bacterium]|nr:CsbD family protein [Alphaproteobacteria bacterium]